VLHVTLTEGDKLEIMVAPKGFGSENMSRVFMLTPAAGRDGVMDCIVEAARLAGSNPCPPMVLGVGIGGDFELCALLAKRALCRPLSQPNPDSYYAEMEKEALDRINRLDIGPQGFGGVTTALGVNIETYPTHIAGLPVAVNVGCHVTRHCSRTL
jgi:fumarate hydratase subunit alpha